MNRYRGARTHYMERVNDEALRSKAGRMEAENQAEGETTPLLHGVGFLKK